VFNEANFLNRVGNYLEFQAIDCWYLLPAPQGEETETNSEILKKQKQFQ